MSAQPPSADDPFRSIFEHSIDAILLATPEGSAVSWQGAADWTLVAISRPDGRRWTVLGNRPREELLRVAESLPGQ